MKIKRLLNDEKYEKLLKIWRNPEYFLNWRQANFTWEEKTALKYVLDFLSGNKLQNLGTYIKYDEETEDPVDVEVFYIWIKDHEGIIRKMDIFNSWERGSDIKHFLSLYKKFGSHWGAVKAGLRGIYEYHQEVGEVGFERRPTNW